jgi:hypothetical protein
MANYDDQGWVFFIHVTKKLVRILKLCSLFIYLIRFFFQ